MKGIQIQSYDLLGLDYYLIIDNNRITLRDITDKELDLLINYNQKNRKTREFADEMIYIFNDVKKLRRKEKLKILCSK